MAIHPLDDAGKEYERLSLAKAMERMAEECRLVLPGIQALFGFQLIAVFNQRFGDKLDHTAQILHVAALLLVALAMSLIMAPAIFHRIVHPRANSSWLLKWGTGFLLWSTLPLVLGLSLDVYIITLLVVQNFWPAFIAGGFFLWLIVLWYVIPLLNRKAHGH